LLAKYLSRGLSNRKNVCIFRRERERGGWEILSCLSPSTFFPCLASSTKAKNSLGRFFSLVSHLQVSFVATSCERESLLFSCVGVNAKGQCSKTFFAAIYFTQHNDTQNNYAQHNDVQNSTKLNSTLRIKARIVLAMILCWVSQISPLCCVSLCWMS
jgi:hypothetical protein